MRIKRLLIFIVLCGCTTVKPIADKTITQDNLSIHLKSNDVIRVDKKDGEKKKLVLDSLEETYLIGHNYEGDVMIIPYSLIDEIRVHQFSTGKSIALGLGSSMVIYLIVNGIINSSGGGGWYGSIH